MSFVEIQEFADGYFFTQIFTSLRGRDMHRLLDSFIGRNILDFTIFLRDINGAPWKHVTLLEKPDDLSSNYFESLFPLWFRGPYLSFIGNGLSTQGNIAEFCGSIISPGQRPTPQELIEVLNFKKFIAHVLEKTENCRKFGLKFVEEHNNLHESIYLLGKEMGFKGGSWCIFPTPRNSTIFEENVTSIKTLFSNLLGNLFGPDPTTAWKDIWRMSLRISPDNVMIKLSNTYSSYFDDHKKYGYDVEHHELWFYRRDTQVYQNSKETEKTILITVIVACQRFDQSSQLTSSCRLSVCGLQPFLFCPAPHSSLTAMTRLQQWYFLTALLLLQSTDAAGIPSVTCLDDCICELSESNPLIRCEAGDRTEVNIPKRAVGGFEILALPCNNIVNLPTPEILQAFFPDVKAIDVEGNPSFNCSQLDMYKKDFVINSDCGKDVPFDCASIEKECDFKCSGLHKIKELWKKFKETIARKAKEWGADQAFQDVQDWFHSTYRSLTN
ncbi:unnamed protein product [Auanema sp. JU1783]|nr:unnamed protein product [Auanema sp. JU1783]